MRDSNCVFCKIVAGEIPARTIWEDDKHIAFLNMHPNTEGFTVLIPKEHYGSYFVDLPEDVYLDLVKAARTVARHLDSRFEDVGRTGLMFEGFGVNHIHAKLVPMHGTVGEWKQRLGGSDEFFDTYPGYISSHDGPEADAETLDATWKKLRP